MSGENILIAYFSGTGNTKYVADTLARKLESLSCRVLMQSVENKDSGRQTQQFINDNISMMIVLFPVYAFNSPQPINEWLETLPVSSMLPVAVLSVSGGGEIWPNSLSRVQSIKTLEAKGYNVFYENMLVMPSNIFVQTNDDLSAWLIRALPEKLNVISEDILKHRGRRIDTPLGFGFTKWFSNLEQGYSGQFGQSLIADSRCNNCGWCVDSCPRSNIRTGSGGLVFGGRCILCMRCIYGCPQKAIYSTKYKSFILRNGFSLDRVIASSRNRELETIEICSRGLLWIGVKRYLTE